MFGSMLDIVKNSFNLGRLKQCYFLYGLKCERRKLAICIMVQDNKLLFFLMCKRFMTHFLTHYTKNSTEIMD